MLKCYVMLIPNVNYHTPVTVPSYSSILQANTHQMNYCNPSNTHHSKPPIAVSDPNSQFVLPFVPTGNYTNAVHQSHSSTVHADTEANMVTEQTKWQQEKSKLCNDLVNAILNVFK